MANKTVNTGQLRNLVKTRRAALKAAEVKQMSAQIAQRLMDSPAFQQAQHIACYLSVRGEADPALLCSQQDTQGRQFYLPVLKQNGEIGLDFIMVDEQTRFTPNDYGIPEPVYEAGKVLEAKQLDLVITPLVCFDRQLNRIGMGGGFYDRTFAFKKTQAGQNHGRNHPLLIGYAYEFQRVDTIVAQPWDVKLDAVVTESHYYQ